MKLLDSWRMAGAHELDFSATSMGETDVLLQMRGFEDIAWCVHGVALVRACGLHSEWKFNAHGPQSALYILRLPWRKEYFGSDKAEAIIDPENIVTALLEIAYFYGSHKATSPTKLEELAPNTRAALQMLIKAGLNPRTTTDLFLRDTARALDNSKFLINREPDSEPEQEPTKEAEVESVVSSDGVSATATEKSTVQKPALALSHEERAIVLNTLCNAVNAVQTVLNDAKQNCSEQNVVSAPSTTSNRANKVNRLKQVEQGEQRKQREWKEQDKQNKQAEQEQGLDVQLYDARARIARLSKMLEVKTKENLDMNEIIEQQQQQQLLQPKPKKTKRQRRNRVHYVNTRPPFKV